MRFFEAKYDQRDPDYIKLAHGGRKLLQLSVPALLALDVIEIGAEVVTHNPYWQTINEMGQISLAGAIGIAAAAYAEHRYDASRSELDN